MRIGVAPTLSLSSLAYAGYCQKCAVTISVATGGTSTCGSPCGGTCTYSINDDWYCTWFRNDQCGITETRPGSAPVYSNTCVSVGRGGCVCPTSSGSATGASVAVPVSETCVAAYP